MKGLIIYTGKYGATAQYAQWLGHIFNLDVASTKDCSNDVRLSQTDYFLVGTSVYFNRSLISKFLNDKQQILKKKKIFLFVCSATPEIHLRNSQKFLKSNVPAALSKNLEIFFLPGRLEIRKLSNLDYYLTMIAAILETNPRKKQVLLHGMDHVKFENLATIIAAVENFLVEMSDVNVSPING